MTRRVRRFALGGLAAAAMLVAVAAFAFQISRARCFSLTGEAICRVETRERVVALSFDDGPTPQGVEWAIAILAPRDAHATFFLIGGEVRGQEALVRRLLAGGHEVGNHSFSHVRMVGRSAGFYDREIAKTDFLLRRSGVAEPGLFRPPYGKKLFGLPRAIERHGYRMIMWDVEDPPGAATPRDYARQVVAETRPGSIILMHVMYKSNQVAREALPLVVDGLKARDLQVVTVGELLRRRAAAR
jgi:peptidoglycan/xylan/chitin deacetylase (PgdA/CDA1 family)